MSRPQGGANRLSPREEHEFNARARRMSQEHLRFTQRQIDRLGSNGQNTQRQKIIADELSRRSRPSQR